MKKYIKEKYFNSENGEKKESTLIINKTILKNIISNSNKYREGSMESFLDDKSLSLYLKLSHLIKYKDIKYVNSIWRNDSLKIEYSRYNIKYCLEIC